MKAWLHFVGRQYYSKAKFVKEARKYGITRRVSLRDLKQMDWGDLVLLAMRSNGRKTPEIFGSFAIKMVSGLSPEASAAIRERFRWWLVDNGGRVIGRGCGRYVEGPCYVLENATLPEVAAILEELKKQGVDIGKPMVGGSFEPHRPVRLKSIPFRQGFRLFDYDRLLQNIGFSLSTMQEPVTVSGQYYVKDDKAEDGKEPAEGLIREVADYRRKEEM